VKDRIVEIVTAFYAENDQGMTRAELAEAIGWKQTRNLPGVRAAIDEGLIRYDGTGWSRLEPSTESKP
jgi:hypothetical protein